MSEEELKRIENNILAHRYIYYVLNDSVIPDSYYDREERKARAVLPPSSPVQGIGSSNKEDYSEEVISLANTYLE